jgi:hypothetical protein
VCDALKVVAVLHWLLNWAEMVLSTVVFEANCWEEG